MLSHFSHVQLVVTPRTVAHQAPLSMWFSKKEYWSGLSRLPPKYKIKNSKGKKKKSVYFTFLPTMYEWSNFSTSSHQHLVLPLYFNYSDKCVVISQCSFNVHFLHVKNVLNIFLCAYLPLLYICNEISGHIFYIFLNWIFFTVIYSRY